jgi:hypothetical protein
MKTCFILFLIHTSLSLASSSSLDSLMSEKDKKETGYNTLSSQQKSALNRWIHKHFSLNKKNEDSSLSLSVNVRSGAELILSDGSKWEVAPEDQSISSLWITPFPLKIIPDKSPSYPFTLINLSSEERVKVKPIPKGQN